jgi:hypothetical protein
MCIPTYVCTYLRIYIPTYVCTYLHMYIPTYVHTYVCTYLHMYIPTYVHTYVCTYLRMYIPTYIHTYICTCLHMYLDTTMTCSQTWDHCHDRVNSFTHTIGKNISDLTQTTSNNFCTKTNHTLIISFKKIIKMYMYLYFLK